MMTGPFLRLSNPKEREGYVTIHVTNEEGRPSERPFPLRLLMINGRGERIRTSDLSVPNRAHYQAVLRPETRLRAEVHSRDARMKGQVRSSQSSRKERIASKAFPR